MLVNFQPQYWFFILLPPLFHLQNASITPGIWPCQLLTSFIFLCPDFVAKMLQFPKPFQFLLIQKNNFFSGYFQILNHLSLHLPSHLANLVLASLRKLRLSQTSTSFLHHIYTSVCNWSLSTIHDLSMNLWKATPSKYHLEPTLAVQGYCSSN